MFAVFETVDYIDGVTTAQLCGTYNTFEAAHSLVYLLYHDELASDDTYDEEWCEMRDDFATVGGEGGFPRVMRWYIFDSNNPEIICT